ncbi:hypothetical protein R6Q59_035273 [Mikania micrantha]|uniref:Armadillo repeat-containing domain-containing protein n=1 Tax=Mikania micrantha TaxID=192012 RepID=A0A5N6NF24_9ASTR|nr:hypothetical protein E3N88_24015 [Mikania micrantha]
MSPAEHLPLRRRHRKRRGDSGAVLSLPPIASNDPIIAWVWSYISLLYLCPLIIRIEVSNELCSLANVNVRNKKIIAEEGGIPPFVEASKRRSPEAQIAAAITILNLANDQDKARVITDGLGVMIIVQSLQKSTIRN